MTESRPGHAWREIVTAAIVLLPTVTGLGLWPVSPVTATFHGQEEICDEMGDS